MCIRDRMWSGLEVVEEMKKVYDAMEQSAAEETGDGDSTPNAAPVDSKDESKDDSKTEEPVGAGASN